EKNITIIISSHILSELEQIATVYGFLSQGWLLRELTAEQLHEHCAGYLEIKVSDPERYAALLEKEMDGVQYKVMPDLQIRIQNPQLPVEAYSGLASGYGVSIMRLEQKQKSLEEYYMELKERGRLSC
ncbi:MAG: ABC transporter ATP-binding protein, partial [Muricomes sp.]|nr:ABC transporter ATP-binding protein [Muricomes sp.]